MGRLTRIRKHIVSADAIYGTILFAALIASSSLGHSESDGIPGDSTDGVTINVGAPDQAQMDLLETLLVSGITLLVFWLAHVYARTVAGHGGAGMRGSIRKALDSSAGMLWSAIPSTIVLLLGVLGIIPDAEDWSLLVAIVVLGVLGYQSYAERGSPIWARILGALVSGLLGLILVILKVAVH